MAKVKQPIYFALVLNWGDLRAVGVHTVKTGWLGGRYYGRALSPGKKWEDCAPTHGREELAAKFETREALEAALPGVRLAWRAMRDANAKADELARHTREKNRQWFEAEVAKIPGALPT